MAHDHAPDPRDLPGPFPHVVTTTVRFADTDARGHVNNASYLTYCEIARLRYWADVSAEMGPESLILADARITYRDQTYFGEVVTVQSRASRIGRSSFTLEHRLLAGRPGEVPRLVAVSESVLVRYDYETAKAIPLSGEQVGAIEHFEGRRLRP